MPESRTRTLAKTTRPVLASSVVPRPRLFQRLDQALAGSAVWIHAVPGAGKTCLVSSFVEARGLQALWYQVDAGDGDPASFFAHLRHALRRRFGDAIAVPPAPTGACHEDAWRRLFRAVYGAFEETFVFVLDNCHELPATSALHRAMVVAVEEVPARGTVIFLARRGPEAAMAKLRASEAMTVLAQDALELTGEELRAIAAARGVSLDEATAQALEDAARGWAAGLVLMLERVRAGGAATRAPQGLAPQLVFDYLASEVFQTFDPEVRDTLCAVSVLRRFTAELAETVSDDTQARPVLINLASNNYFLTRVDEGRHSWFELHPLFHNFLVKQSARCSSGDRRLRQVRKAARWLLDNDCADEAASLLAQAGEWQALAEAVARRGDEVFSGLGAAGLGRLLHGVPDEVACAHPWLLLWSAACRLPEDPRAARRLYARAHEAFESLGGADPVGLLQSASGALRAVLEEFDDLSVADPWVARLELQLQRGGAELPDGERERAARTLHAALVLRGAGRDRLQACAALAGSHGAEGAPQKGPGCWPLWAVAACLSADFATAADPLPGAQAQEEGQAAWSLVAAFYHLLRGESGACGDALARARESSGGDGLCLLLAAALEAARALSAGSSCAGEEVSVLPEVGPHRLRAALAGFLAGWRASEHGEGIAAFHRAREGAVAAAQLGAQPLEILCQALVAQLAASCGDTDEASRTLDLVTGTRGLPVVEFATRVATARVEQLALREAQARSSLAAAFASGRGHGLRFAPGVTTRAAAELCAFALRWGIEPDYARSLIRAHGLTAHAPCGAPEAWPWPVRVFSLGALKVLRSDQPLRLSGKGEGRQVELLKVLAALGGREVPQEQLAATLWPHVDGDYAYRSFTTTLYRLRRALEVTDAVLIDQGRVSLNPACCWLDTWALETLSETIDRAFWDGAEAPSDDEVAGLGRNLAALHRGAFLAGESQHAAVVARRAQLRRRVQRALVRLAGHWVERADQERAIDLLQRALDVDPGAEGLYREMMLLLERFGRRAEVLEVYEICTRTLATTGASPDERMGEIARRASAVTPQRSR